MKKIIARKILLFTVSVFIFFPVFGGNSETYIVKQIQTDSTKVKGLKKSEIYIQTTVDDSGKLFIITKDMRKIVMSKDSGQVGFEKIAISEDGHSVGWLADYPNLSTSYPIPLALRIYSDGILHEFKGNELPVWKWKFYSGSKQVAFEQETVHGDWGIHYELRDIASEKLIDSFNPEYGPDNRVLKVQKNTPKWVKELD